MRLPFLSNDIAHTPVDLALAHRSISRPRSFPGLRKHDKSVSTPPPARNDRMAPWDGGHPDPRRRGSWRHSAISGPHSPSQTHPPYPSDRPAHSQWDGVPVSFHSQDMPPPSATPDPLHTWRLRPGEPAPGRSNRTQGRARQRPPPAVRLENMEGRGDGSGPSRNPDVSLLYPQPGPYEDQFRTRSVPDQLESQYRSFSQPNTPAFNHSRTHLDEPPLHLNPRSPTYPPATQSRGHRVTTAREATFDDDVEFHLFAEATAGLDPIQTFHRTGSSPSSYGREARTERERGRESAESQYPSSPTQETPTTLHALQQLAQMPQGSRLQQHRRGDDIETWLQATSLGDEFNLDEDELGFMEDELPDYAASQAQAQAAQRIEATRRAQELQRRWQQSRHGGG